jgi:hypothetical protein
MSIQTTLVITKEEALERFVKKKQEEIYRSRGAEFNSMEYTHIQNYIEEDFYNFVIEDVKTH